MKTKKLKIKFGRETEFNLPVTAMKFTSRRRRAGGVGEFCRILKFR